MIDENKLLNYMYKRNFVLLENGKEEVSMQGVIERFIDEVSE